MDENLSQSRAYKNYLVILLMVILAFNLVDRLALGIVLQDIKVELDLTDTQLGLMSGIAFALFYSVMGIPIARWADRGNRVMIISLTAALWSIMVALCGMAGSFVHLLLIRIGVGVGEAGCIPPAHSLMADYFTRAERPRAAAVYALGGPLAFIVGYFVAGWLNELYGWRATFIILGAPGLILAALAWLTLAEPRRRSTAMEFKSGMHREPTAASDAYASLGVVCRMLWSNRTFRHLLLSFCAVHFFGYGILQWQPTFFARSFGLQSGELGTWFAVIYGVGGGLGTYLGGALATRYAANNECLQLKGMAATTTGHGVLLLLVYLSLNKYLAFGLLAVACLGVYAIYGPFFGTVQTLVPARLRAMSIALIYLFANLIGLGLGPLAAGALSDVLHMSMGQESLRYALLILAPGFFLAAWHFWLASKTVACDVAAVRTEHIDSPETSRSSMMALPESSARPTP